MWPSSYLQLGSSNREEEKQVHDDPVHRHTVFQLIDQSEIGGVLKWEGKKQLWSCQQIL